MVEVSERLYAGNEQDYEGSVRHDQGWSIVHACKEPYHRHELGYTERGAPKGHPEYLIARRGHRLILNLVDAPRPEFFSTDIFDAALDFIQEALERGDRVLVHCNEGLSRGPSLCLLYLASRAKAIPATSHAVAEEAFVKLYPSYAPKSGVRGFLQVNWTRYCC